MSGPKSSTVTYVPTAAEIAAARRAQLSTLAKRFAELDQRRGALAEAWRMRAPCGAVALVELQLPVIQTTGPEDVADLLAAGSASLAAATAAVATLVTQCVQEEIRLVARKGATEAELDGAARSLAAARLSTRRVVEEPDHEEAGASITGTRELPDADVRSARIAGILARATGELDTAEVAESLEAALRATTDLAYQSALGRARRCVEDAEERDRRAALCREEAARLFDSLLGLSGPDAEHWRVLLADIVAAGSPLPPGAAAQVDGVRTAAVRARLVAVLDAAGFEQVATPGEALVGYVRQGEDGATKVRVDSHGLLISPVASEPLDAAAAIRLDQANCDLFGRIRGEAADVGVHLDVVSQRAVGEVPVRVEAVPAGKARAVRRRAPAAEAQRRQQ